MKPSLVWTVAIAAIVVLAIFSYLLFIQYGDVNGSDYDNDGNDAVYCTQEVKQCSDGSYVGRDSRNNCAFFPCPADNGDVNEQQTYTVEITLSGFSPKTLTINKGDTVTWVNKLSRQSWPASAVHPTHKSYPGSGIEKCGTSEENQIFDACSGLNM